LVWDSWKSEIASITRYGLLGKKPGYMYEGGPNVQTVLTNLRRIADHVKQKFALTPVMEPSIFVMSTAFVPRRDYQSFVAQKKARPKPGVVEGVV
jgi:hypothetical protein